MTGRFLQILLIFLLGANISFGEQLFLFGQSNSTKVLAKVGNLKIFADEFVNSYTFAPQIVKAEKSPKLRYLEAMINEKLLYLYAKKIKIDTMRQVREWYGSIFNDLMTEQMYKEQILPLVKIDSAKVDTVINQKILHIRLRWIFSKDYSKAKEIFSKQNPDFFNSEYLKQFKDGVKKQDRYLEITRFALGLRNPALAKIIDTLTVGRISAPIRRKDGWYVFKIDKAWKDIIVDRGEFLKLKNEAVIVVKKNEMDRLSDLFVKKIFDSERPTILRIPLNITVGYLANLLLDKEKYKEWKVSGFLKEALAKAKIKKKGEVNNLTLVKFKSGSVSISDFLSWCNPRFQYLRFGKSSFDDFYSSVEQFVWRMLRDNFLALKARQAGYDRSPEVVRQAAWWKEKIVFSALRNKLLSSIMLKNGEVKNSLPEKQDEKQLSKKLDAEMFRLLRKLKRDYKISINKNLLNKLNVEENKDKKINFYIVKQGGLIPRTPYPIIDAGWKHWGKLVGEKN